MIDVKLNRVALTEFRERSGFTKAALAREAGISTGALADLESGRRNASPAMIRRLAEALKVPLPALVADPDEGRP